MMGVLFLLPFVGSVPGNAHGGYRDRMSRANYFLLFAGLALETPIATPLGVRWATRIFAIRSDSE